MQFNANGIATATCPDPLREWGCFWLCDTYLRAYLPALEGL